MPHFRKPVPTTPMERHKVFGGKCEQIYCKHHKWQQVEHTDGTLEIVGTCYCRENTIADKNPLHCQQFEKISGAYNPEFMIHKEIKSDVD